MNVNSYTTRLYLRYHYNLASKSNKPLSYFWNYWRVFYYGRHRLVECNPCYIKLVIYSGNLLSVQMQLYESTQSVLVMSSDASWLRDVSIEVAGLLVDDLFLVEIDGSINLSAKAVKWHAFCSATFLQYYAHFDYDIRAGAFCFLWEVYF